MQNITKNEELIFSSIVRFENFDMQHIKPILAISTFEEIRRSETKPFVKWVRGKRSLSKAISVRMPTSFNDYYEPFLGVIISNV